EQTGMLGLLVALDRFDPERSPVFWACAAEWVRHEIQEWLGNGVFWSGRSAGDRPSRRHRLEERGVNLRGRSVHPSLEHLYERESSEDPETRLGIAESEQRLHVYLSKQSDEDAHILLKGKRVDRKKGFSRCAIWRARRYSDLLEEARRFVRGKDDDE